MDETAPPKNLTLRWIVAFVVTPILALAAAIRTTASHEDFSVLYSYAGDTFFIVLQTKTMLDQGWWTENDMLGAPGRMEFYDYPSNPSLHIAVMKVMSLFESDACRLINAYFLLTFPLLTLFSLAAFKTMRFPPLISASLSLVFAFAPYHFSRGIHHFYLGCYLTVPLSIILIAWVCQNRADLICDWTDGKWRWRLWTLPTVVSVLIGAALGFDFPYFPIFACFLLLVAGIFTAYRMQSKVPAIRAAVLIGFIAFFFVANVAPNMIFLATHAPNESKTIDNKRTWQEAERYGLKIAPLLLPSDGHPIREFRDLRSRYLGETPVYGETSDPHSLGTIGAIGFVVLLWWLLFRQNRGTTPNDQLLDWVSILNVAIILLATMGGLGALFNLLVTPEIRGYNRISIFIMFFALIAFGVLLQRLDRIWKPKGWLKYSFPVFVVLITGASLLETTRCFLRPTKGAVAEFKSDRAFIQQVEKEVEPGGMVFQLPLQEFLSVRGPAYEHGNSPFTHVRAYIHSHHIHWSYGAVTGRETAELQKEISEQPTEELVDSLRELGFRGIYIERRLYDDHGEAIEAELQQKLDEEPLVSADGNLSFFLLSDPPPDSLSSAE